MVYWPAGGTPTPIHGWTRLGPAAWHDRHVGWLAELRRGLDGGGLPSTHYASIAPGGTAGGEGDLGTYVFRRWCRNVYRATDDRLVSIIEILSPRIKAATPPLDMFVHKAVGSLRSGIHLFLTPDRYVYVPL